MKRIALLSLVLILGGVSFAWAGKEAYTLAMSKDRFTNGKTCSTCSTRM